MEDLDIKLSNGLDYYKATMGQVEFEKHADAIVTFELKNRSADKLSDFVSPEELRDRLVQFQGGWNPDEIAYLASLQAQDGTARFSREYLDFLMDNELPPVSVALDDSGELSVKTTGAWPLVTFWETVVMSELNELYFSKKMLQDGVSLEDLYAEGDRRLSEKIAILKDRPDIKFSDFGTRRRFSYGWQKHVVERLAAELPDSFVGTSNIALANELGLTPIGTFAHEMPMVYAGLVDAEQENPMFGHNQMLQDWQTTYGGELSTALTDTFGSEFFFTDFTREQAREWQSLRHDSGDPIEFGERVIEFYEQHEIDPMEKTVVFSDGLNIDTILQLADHFKGRINLLFGWGTTLTNDLGVKANNFVMKAVEVNGVGTVKLSDVAGKHTGSENNVERYIMERDNVIRLGAEAWRAAQTERTAA